MVVSSRFTPSSFTVISMSFTVSPGAKVRLVPFTTYCFPASAVPPVTAYSTFTGFLLTAVEPPQAGQNSPSHRPGNSAYRNATAGMGAVFTMVRVWTALLAQDRVLRVLQGQLKGLVIVVDTMVLDVHHQGLARLSRLEGQDPARKGVVLPHHRRPALHPVLHRHRLPARRRELHLKRAGPVVSSPLELAELALTAGPDFSSPLELALSNDTAGSGSVLTMVTVLVVVFPCTACVGTPMLTTTVLSSSFNPLSDTCTGIDALLVPALITTGPGGMVKFPGVFAVPLTMSGTVTSLPDTAESSTPIVAVPAFSFTCWLADGERHRRLGVCCP